MAKRNRGGRPKKANVERYPSGQIKRELPNPLVLEHRAMLCDNPVMATIPLDTALANGWITEDQHRAGVMFKRIHARAQIGAPGVQLSADRSVPVGSGARDLQFAHLTDKEIVSIWESAMPDEPTADEDETRASRAMKAWRALNEAMRPEVRQEVFNVCILDSWPQWIIQRRAGRFDTSWERKYLLLIDGLAVINRFVERPRMAA